jgi:purine-binding chemotaxis protein CheW
MVVDKVTDVMKIEPGAISAPDDVLRGAGYLVGVAKIDKRLVLVADIEKILSGEDKDRIKGVHKKVEVKKRG